MAKRKRSLLRMRTDLPLDRDSTARFLPWIIGFMVYLAMIAATVALLVERATDRWQRDLSSQLTVELPAMVGEDAGARAERIDAAVRQISGTDGVISTRLLDEAEVARLLAPWLGDAATELGVPLPDLIAVSLQPGVAADIGDLRLRIQEASPGAVVDDHAAFNSRAMGFLRTVEVMAVTLLILVLTATAGVVAFVARAGLSIHRQIVDILHLVGARDAYVARQFQAQAFRFGFVGALIGSLLAAITLLAAAFWSARGEAAIGVAFRAFEPWMIWPLALIPITAVLIAVVTVRIAVQGALRRMAY
jgi:cell division transport system permease protein